MVDVLYVLPRNHEHLRHDTDILACLRCRFRSWRDMLGHACCDGSDDCAGITEGRYGRASLLLAGLLVYFGWVYLATGRGIAPVPPRMFWILSAAVNLGYFIHEYQPWRYLGDYHRSLSGGAYWWLATGLLSIICALFHGKKNGRIGSPGVISSRVPHHPAYGSVLGGSNQTRAFCPK